ncbi:MAG: hypothetical protein ACI8X5_001342 [Planctomycetota bacterium]|jgi:hypothetical protein
MKARNLLIGKLTSLVLLLSFLPGCGDFDFHGQELSLQHDLHSNSLELELRYSGVTVSTVEKKEEYSAKKIEKVKLAVEGVSEGNRYFMLLFREFVFDIDEMLEMIEKEQDLEYRALWKEAVDSISITEARVHLDKRDRVGIYQRIGIQDARRFTQLIQELVQGSILGGAKDGEFGDKGLRETFDAETQLAWIAEAKEGVQWFSWVGRDLHISLPMSPSSAARLMKATLVSQAKIEEKTIRNILPSLFSLASEIRLENDHLYITLSGDDQGVMRFSREEPKLEYDTSLVEALRESGFQFSPKPGAR